MVQVILKEHIDQLGDATDIVDVRPGYARNYLIPNGMAVVASTPNLLMLKELRAEMKAAADEKKSQAESIKKEVETIGTVSIQASVGPTGKLFGRVTASDVQMALSTKSNSRLPKKSVRIAGHAHGVDEVGTYDVVIDLGSTVMASLKLEVVEAA